MKTTKHYAETLKTKQEVKERIKQLKKAYGEDFKLTGIQDRWCFLVYTLNYTLTRD